MSNGDRFLYKTATVLDQAFLNNCADNLTNQLELAVDIETPTGFIHASDRNKYIDGVFYEALLTFPTIRRTVGDFLDSTLEFSELQLELSNVDGRFNNFLPEGADFGNWVGKSVEIKLGLRDVGTTYTTIFRGSITEVGGFGRTVKSIVLKARDDFDALNVDFPKQTLTKALFPVLVDDLVGTVLPIIYGDWTTALITQAIANDPGNQGGAAIPAFPTNTNPDDPVGADVVDGLRNPVNFIISSNENQDFDKSQVFLRRGTQYFRFDSADITDIGINKNEFSITQLGVTTIDGGSYEYDSADEIFVQVKGKPLGLYDDNIVAQAQDIILDNTTFPLASFDTTWQTYKDKASPAESAIASFKSRAWIQEPVSALSYALSMLEQVRLEAFIDRNLKLKLTALHFDEFDADPDFEVKNFDVARNSFRPTVEDKTNFNRAQGFYSFLPDLDENAFQTEVYRNSAAILQVGKEVSRQIVFPNLYEASVVSDQVREMLKLTSGYYEIVDCVLTWRSLLLDIGDFVKLNVKIGASQYTNVPCLIREIGYDPRGISIPVKMWSFQMIPFTGHSPGYAGIVGGSTAIITQE